MNNQKQLILAILCLLIVIMSTNLAFSQEIPLQNESINDSIPLVPENQSDPFLEGRYKLIDCTFTYPKALLNVNEPVNGLCVFPDEPKNESDPSNATPNDPVDPIIPSPTNNNTIPNPSNNSFPNNASIPPEGNNTPAVNNTPSSNLTGQNDPSPKQSNNDPNNNPNSTNNNPSSSPNDDEDEDKTGGNTGRYHGGIHNPSTSSSNKKSKTSTTYTHTQPNIKATGSDNQVNQQPSSKLNSELKSNGGSSSKKKIEAPSIAPPTMPFTINGKQLAFIIPLFLLNGLLIFILLGIIHQILIERKKEKKNADSPDITYPVSASTVYSTNVSSEEASPMKMYY